MPRIMLVHALRDSVAPIHAAFAAAWPEAERHDLLETSLAADHAADGGVLGEKMRERFLALGRYAAEAGPEGKRADAILFTCSAFAPAIEAVAAEQPIPVFKPNEAAYADALALGARIGLLISFAPARASMVPELEEAARAQGRVATVEARLADGALAALQRGDGEEHDRLVAEAAATLPDDLDAVVIGQFSMARAAAAVRARVKAPVLTTPDSAVAFLRRRLEAA